MIMYDSIDVGAIPITATDLLGYTDGVHANIAALRARFPSARIHTISAVGQVVAEWIDVEPGCLWPNQTAVAVFRAWHPQGCKGYYSELSNMQALKEAHNVANPGVTAEYFDANWTGVIHVDPGYVATQDEDPATSGGDYDVSDTTPTFEGAPDPYTIPAEDTVIVTLYCPNATRIDQFGIGTDNTIWQRTAPTVAQLNAAGWAKLTSWEATSISATWSPDSTTLVLSVRGTDGHTGTNWWTGGSWVGWQLDTTFVLLNNIGAAGTPGPVGPQGMTGPPGPTGAPGAAGSYTGGPVTITGTLTT